MPREALGRSRPRVGRSREANRLMIGRASLQPVFCPSAVVWGDAATWATAVITAIAGIGAFWAAVIARRVYRIEQDRDDRAEEERVRWQAERVSAWLQAAEARGTSMSRRIVEIHFANLSEQPVMQLVVDARFPDGTVTELHRRSVLPPGGDLPVPVEGNPRAALFALVPVVHDVDPMYGGPELRADWANIIQDVPLAVTFTDSAGRRWRRSFDNRLEPQTTP